MRVPEEFGEAHADGFESAAGGDDDADGHDGGEWWGKEGDISNSEPHPPELSTSALGAHLSESKIKSGITTQEDQVVSHSFIPLHEESYTTHIHLWQTKSKTNTEN